MATAEDRAYRIQEVENIVSAAVDGVIRREAELESKVAAQYEIIHTNNTSIERLFGDLTDMRGKESNLKLQILFFTLTMIFSFLGAAWTMHSNYSEQFSKLNAEIVRLSSNSKEAVEAKELMTLVKKGLDTNNANIAELYKHLEVRISKVEVEIGGLGYDVETLASDYASSYNNGCAGSQ